LTGADAVGVAVKLGVCVPDDVVVAVTVDDADADEPRDSDAEDVPVAVREPVDVGVCVGVGVAEQRRRIFVEDAAVSGTVASVLLAASRTLIVLLTARVLQPPLIPAAVHAAGGVQHDSVIDARL
jgi:hypothetical protein